MPTPLSQTFGKQASRPKTTTDLSVEITRVTGIWPRKVFVQWVLHNPHYPSGYKFTIDRSSSPEGPWENIATSLADTYFTVDDTFGAPLTQDEPGLFSLRRALYYRVTVVHTSDGTVNTVKQMEAGLDRRRSGIVRKLRRDVNVMLRKGSGTEIAVLKRRWWGEPCDCKTKTGQITRSHCHICYGTGIVSGYWNPVYGFASRSAAPVDEHTATEGNVETHYIQVIMSYLPEVSPRDILVFVRDNKRYIVETVNTTEIHTAMVRQELQVSELARSSREYNIIVDPWHDPEYY